MGRAFCWKPVGLCARFWLWQDSWFVRTPSWLLQEYAIAYVAVCLQDTVALVVCKTASLLQVQQCIAVINIEVPKVIARKRHQTFQTNRKYQNRVKVSRGGAEPLGDRPLLQKGKK
jgi:hypothetical protein